MTIYIAFIGLNTSLLTTHLAVLETAIVATCGALQYWNMVFKRS